MFRLTIIIAIFINFLYSQNRIYFIKLGSFKQLPVLERTINRMPASLRSHITVVKSNGWFIAFAYKTTKRYLLSKRLSAYRKYFYDAYIYTSNRILNAPVIRSYGVTVEKYHPYIDRYPRKIYHPIPKKQYPVTTRVETHPVERIKIPKPTVRYESRTIKPKGFTKRMLSGHKYYLVYKGPVKENNLLIKVIFKNHTVVYQPIIGDMKMREAKYLVDNGKLYMFADTFSENGAFSKIEGYKKDYILVSSWSNGKKLNILRYYYNLNKAKEYLGIRRSSDPLANMLEDSEIPGIYLPNY